MIRSSNPRSKFIPISCLQDNLRKPEYPLRRIRVLPESLHGQEVPLRIRPETPGDQLGGPSRCCEMGHVILCLRGHYLAIHGRPGLLSVEDCSEDVGQLDPGRDLDTRGWLV